MKSFQQFINETIYDQQVKSFMNKKPEVAKSIIDHVRNAHKDGKEVGFRSDPTEVGSPRITHKSSIWTRNPKAKGLAGTGHEKGEKHAEGVHYTPVHPDNNDHEIIRRALTHMRYRSSYQGAKETKNNFHVITGEHDKEASAALNKRRTQGLHPRDAEEEVRDYPEGMLNKNKIVHSVSHNDMWK